MKKMILLAVAVVLGASLNTATAQSKVRKVVKKTTPAATVQKKVEKKVVKLNSSTDTLSYATGRSATMGLLAYLQQQLHVDTAYMADFIKGYEETIRRAEDPQYIAQTAGYQIAMMAKERILPSTQKEFGDTKIDADMFHKGLLSALRKDNSVFNDSLARDYYESHLRVVKEAQAAEYKKENADWLAENAKKEGVITLPSGLQYKVITMGEGEKPQATDKVTVKYEGKMIDGTIFDSSYKRNPQTTSFRCDQVIPGWTEALQLMPVGSKWELYIPQELGYRDRPAGQIKPYSTLIFTVELEGIDNEEN